MLTGQVMSMIVNHFAGIAFCLEGCNTVEK